MDFFIPYIGGFMKMESDGDSKYQFSFKEGDWETAYAKNPNVAQKVTLAICNCLPILGLFI